MNQVFVLANQHQQYFGKSKEWLDGSDSRSLYRSEYKDEAINLMVELTVKDPDVRIQIKSLETAANGALVLPTDDTSSTTAEPNTNLDDADAGEADFQAEPKSQPITHVG